MQKLFSANGGAINLPVILKIVNTAAARRHVNIELAGVGKSGMAYLLTGDLNAENSLPQPMNVAPVEAKLTLSSTSFDYELAPDSPVVLRLPCSMQ